MHCSLDMAHNGCNCYFFVLGYFLPFFYLSNSQKNQILKKWKKCLEISFHNSVPKIMIICHNTAPEIWHRYNYFSLWAIFCLLNPLTARKIQIYKKWKKYFKISSFCKRKKFCICVPKIMISSWDIVHDRQMDR